MAKPKKRKRINQFIKLFVWALALFSVVSALGTTVYVLVAKNNIVAKLINKPIVSQTANGENSLKDVDKQKTILTRPITTVALFGVDAMGGYRTDVVLVGFFNHDKVKFDFVSIPRDTLVVLPDDIYQQLHKRRSDLSRTLPINLVPAYEESKKRNETSVQVLEKVFGVKIDYFVNLDLKRFKEIVDLVGPIPIDLPKKMDYDDPLQNLYIHLKAGPQELNGAQAEQLIRYRDTTGDIGRIPRQQLFVKAFVKKALSPENRLNMPALAQEVLNSVTTNFNDAVDYLIYLDKIKPENIYFHVLPGKPSGARYVYDADGAAKLFEKIINDAKQPASQNGKTSQPVNKKTEDNDLSIKKTAKKTDVKVDVQPSYDVKKMPIGIYNGTMISGLAGKTKEKLEKDGYQVVKVSNNEQKPIKKTQLVVPDVKLADELLPYFRGAEVKVDSQLMGKPEEIKIILGETEGN